MAKIKTDIVILAREENAFITAIERIREEYKYKEDYLVIENDEISGGVQTLTISIDADKVDKLYRLGALVESIK